MGPMQYSMIRYCMGHHRRGAYLFIGAYVAQCPGREASSAPAFSQQDQQRQDLGKQTHPRLAKTKAWTDVSSCDRHTSSLGTAASELASSYQNLVFKRSLQGFATVLH